MPADEVSALADDLGELAGDLPTAIFDAFDEAGEQTAERWADNVREVAPKHLPHLPGAIDHEARYTFGGVSVDVGPESGKRQANLAIGDEYGSRNQPPHLSGLNAQESVEPDLERDATEKIGRLVP